MAKYEVFITKTVQKRLKKLPNKIADKLETQMLQLEDNPRPPYCKKTIWQKCLSYPIRKLQIYLHHPGQNTYRHCHQSWSSKKYL